MKKDVRNVIAVERPPADGISSDHMPIYTRTGDKGSTSLFGGVRVSKDAPRVHAYGDLDELDSFIALAGAHVTDEVDQKLFLEIQRDLYYIMTMLSGGPVDAIHTENIKKRIDTFEQAIDTMAADLPALHHFILPQGDITVGMLHVCRAVCRRAERHIVTFLSQDIETENTKGNLMIQYLNRLSDLLFMLARKYNKGKEITLDR